MTKIKELFKTYFSDTKKIIEIIGTLGFTMIFLGAILSPIVSFAGLEPVKSITITSENLSYENNEPGSWQITKSAKWISKGKARITIELDTLVKTNNVNTDVILVLDTSGSMSGERLDKVKADTTSLIADILSNENNNVSLITFSTTSEIINDFTKDTTALIDSINNLEALGNTNYYQALVNVDKILKNYTWEENKDCVVLFLTDGYPNENSPNEIAQYNYLKTTYPRLVINSIQYEMGEIPLEVLKKISDNQYNANKTNLETYLYRASMSPLLYEKFEIVDYINTEYFNIIDESSIKTNSGTYTLENNKITWNLDKINSGSSHKLTIDINLNEGLSGLGEVYPTNTETEVKTKIDTIEEIVLTQTSPRLTDTYKIIFEENTPNECIVSNMPSSTTASIFDIIEITSQDPTCEGYKFKEWKLINNIEKINDNSFIMPEEDVTLRAIWTKLSSTKSMDGKVSLVQNLYQMMADNSTPDNIVSEFVTNETGVDFSKTSSNTNGKGIYQAADTATDEYPIYYYRGEIENNNLVFANFCWKIVRTTSTGGVKIIYNGIPNEDGSCTATADDTAIGKSAFNPYTSLAYNGYMYGDVYGNRSKTTNITGIGQKNQNYKTEQSNSNYFYSKQISYDEVNGYTLVNEEQRIWSDTYSVNEGNIDMYTCFSETAGTSCETIYYITGSNNINLIYYITFAGGETAEEVLNREVIYGNDVTYNTEKSLYSLKTTYKSKIKDWLSDYEIIAGTTSPGYHYTCLNTTGECEKVLYIYSLNENNIGYIEISNGQNIEEVFKNMTYESPNTNSSYIKLTIDEWYEKNLKDYETQLEDTPFCNDRRIDNIGGWDKDSNNLNKNITFSSSLKISNGTPSLTCEEKNDAFTVSSEIGNGKLTYPIGLLSADEILYAGGTHSVNTSYYLYINQYFWTMTPNRAGGNYIIYMTGLLQNNFLQYSHNVRPSISLKLGTKTFDGDGSKENPFIVK